jgi:hypothetical protein
MSASRSFRSLVMAASCASAALGCYLVSLRVASERAALENVETKIVLAQRNLRVLQTEIGTRGRLAQLERWNVKVLALSAPSADQFLSGSFELARMTQPQHQPAIDAPVVLAAAPAPDKAPIGADASDDAGATKRVTITAGAAPRDMLNQASLKSGTREVPANPVVPGGETAVGKSKGQPVTAAKPAIDRPLGKPGLAAAKPSGKKVVDKPAVVAARPVTKPERLAKADPLAAIPAGKLRSPRKEPAPPQ